MHVESSSKYLEVGARVELTLVSGTYRCLTFIVSVAVHDEAACGIHVARLTIILCTGLPQYCKRVLKKVGVAWWPRFRGQTDQGPVFRSMICLASVWGPLSGPHSVNVSAARAYSAPVFLIYIYIYIFGCVCVPPATRPLEQCALASTQCTFCFIVVQNLVFAELCEFCVNCV